MDGWMDGWHIAFLKGCQYQCQTHIVWLLLVFCRGKVFSMGEQGPEWRGHFGRKSQLNNGQGKLNQQKEFCRRNLRDNCRLQIQSISGATRNKKTSEFSPFPCLF
jgi:hypothetical protein